MEYKGLKLHNINEIIEKQGVGYLSRLPQRLHEQLGHERGLQMTGAEIRLIPSEKVVITIGSRDSFVQSKAIIMYDGHYAASETLVVGETQLEIYPTYPFTTDFKKGVEVRIVLIGENFYIKDVQGKFETFDDHRKKYLAYGTSITQGLYTNQAEGAYPYILGRDLDYEVHNYGMSGCAYCETETVDFLCGLGEFDLITLELSVNMFVDGYSLEEYINRIDHLIKSLHLRNPKAVIYCIGMLPFYQDIGLVHPEQKNTSAADIYREAYKSCVEGIGSDRVIYVDPKPLLSVKNLCTDMIHPSSTGMFEIASNLKAFIKVNSL